MIRARGTLIISMLIGFSVSTWNGCFRNFPIPTRVLPLMLQTPGNLINI